MFYHYVVSIILMMVDTKSLSGGTLVREWRESRRVFGPESRDELCSICKS